MSDTTKKKRNYAGKTPAPTQERIFAHYCVCQNYAETAEKFGKPYETVIGIVKRLAGDRLAEIRTAMRADLARKAWKKVDELLPEIRPSQLGTEKSSAGLEAARALGEVGRIAAILDPKDKDVEQAPPNITVHVGCPPPPEVAKPEPTE